MFRSVHREQRIARKEYACNSCEHLFEFVGCGEAEDMSAVQKERFSKLLSVGGKIKKGDLYWRETIESDGELQTVRYLEVAHQLCIQLDCYPRL